MTIFVLQNINYENMIFVCNTLIIWKFCLQNMNQENICLQNMIYGNVNKSFLKTLIIQLVNIVH